MKCREAREWILTRCDAPLGVEVEQALHAHLESCVACAAEAGDHQQLRRWLADLPLEEPSAQFDWRLRLAISKAEHESIPPLFEPAGRGVAPRLEFWSAAAAAAAVVLGLGLFAMRSQTPGADNRVADRSPAPSSLMGPPMPAAEVRVVRDGPDFGPQKPIPDSYFYLFPAQPSPAVGADTVPVSAPPMGR